MRSRTTFFLLFIAVAAGLHLGMSWLAHRAGDVYKQGVFMVAETKRAWAREPRRFQDGKLSVVFLGNSIQLAGLNPSAFNETLSGKTDAYNFALPALPIGPGYFAVRDATHSWGKPDVIVVRLVTDRGVEPGLFDYNAIQGLGFPGEFFSYLFKRPNKVFALNYLVPARMYTNETVRYLKNIFIDRGDIAATRERNASILARLKEDRGWYYIEQQKMFADGRLPDGYDLSTSTAGPAALIAGEFDWNDDPYLRPFFDFTAKNGIKVFLINSVYRSGVAAPFERMPPSFKKIPLEYPNVRVSSQSWQAKFLPNRYFSDRTHLNPEGARVYTEIVAREFAEAFADELSVIPTNAGIPR